MKTSMSLENAIKNRRTTRNFISKKVPEEYILKIAESGMSAPYGGATGIPLKEIRKIFIISTDSLKMEQLNNLLISQIRRNSRKISLMLFLFPFLNNKMKPFSNRLKAISKNGIPSLHDASHYIIIAEKKGFPPVEKQSIAHALQNMWLTATSLGLGFQLISATGIMTKNKKFISILGLRKGEYAIDGCVIGYPIKKQKPRK